jgi:hypothetical protein
VAKNSAFTKTSSDDSSYGSNGKENSAAARTSGSTTKTGESKAQGDSQKPKESSAKSKFDEK